jgi:hypothetical protein
LGSEGSGPIFIYTGVNPVESHEARIGTSVRVLDGARRPPGKGRVGRVERTYGHPNYLAMDVRFEDGSVELYWYHELGRIEGAA